jgi:hypothetical protein
MNKTMHHCATPSVAMHQYEQPRLTLPPLNLKSCRWLHKLSALPESRVHSVISSLSSFQLLLQLKLCQLLATKVAKVVSTANDVIVSFYGTCPESLMWLTAAIWFYFVYWWCQMCNCLFIW